MVLHGFTGCGRSMRVLDPAFAGGDAVHYLDLIGHGDSDAPAELAPYTMQRCTAQLLGVLEALEARRVHLVGYSMGGRAALSLAVAHPERIASLALIGASAGLADFAERAERRRADEALADRILEHGLEAFVDAWMALPLFASQRRLGARALARMRAERLAASPIGLANSLRGMGSGAMPALHGALACLDRPVLLLAGAEDLKFRGIAAELCSALPRAECAEIPEAGHAAHLEQPEILCRVLGEFIGGVDIADAADATLQTGEARAGQSPGQGIRQ